MTNPLHSDFTAETLDWLSSSKLEHRQAFGQFMTPKSLRTYLLDQLDFKPGDRVLDPASGTGEFLKQALEKCAGIEVEGWDVDADILAVAGSVVPAAKLVCRSALDEYRGRGFDFVIGNPPYFEVKLERDVKERFRDVIGGRPNIYGLFFKVAIDALKVGGTLAFVVPPSMNAGAYFQKLRMFLTEGNHVLSLKVFNDPTMFVDAQTAVQVIVVRKGEGKSRNVFEIEDKVSGRNSLIFSQDPKSLEKMYEGAVSLLSLGYKATTGSTVWNQFKDQLVNIEDNATVPLFYARNISDGQVLLSADERRPQYIKTGRTLTGEAIIVNRIIGGVGKGTIKAALVPEGYKFAAENHLNVIKAVPGMTQKVSYQQLYRMISAPEVIDKARALTGNTQLSASEWNYLIPLSQSIQT